MAPFTATRLLPVGVVALVAAALPACSSPPADRLCDAIARKDVGAVQQVLGEVELDLTKNLGPCTPVEAVFGAAGRRDSALTAIGVEFVKAGLPATAGWTSPATGQRMTAVSAAAGRGNVELVRALLAVGLDIDGPEAGDALVRAAEGGHLDVVTALVEAGVPPDTGEAGRTPLAVATANDHREVADYLQAKLAPPSPPTRPPGQP